MKNKIESVVFGLIIVTTALCLVTVLGFALTYMVGFELEPIGGVKPTTLDEIGVRTITGIALFGFIKGCNDIGSLFEHAVKFYQGKSKQ